jgi:hypothetical protein
MYFDPPPKQEKDTVVRENGVVDFDHWSESTTPGNLLRVSINENNGRIRRQSNFGWHLTFLDYSWLNNIHLNNTKSTT